MKDNFFTKSWEDAFTVRSFNPSIIDDLKSYVAHLRATKKQTPPNSKWHVPMAQEIYSMTKLINELSC